MEAFLSLLFGLVLIVGIFFGVTALAGAQCTSKWSEEFQPRYDLFSKCTIVVNGVRIPETAYRVL